MELTKNKTTYIHYYHLKLSIIINAGIIVLRVLFTMKPDYLFLIWNLFLAGIPFLLSSFILKRQIKEKWKLIPLVILIVLFLPNSPYIITDFSHLLNTETHVFWFDIILIMLSAMNGLLFFLFTLHNLNKIFRLHLSKEKTAKVLFILLPLSAYGVFIGRFLRWNSWDIFIHPWAIIKDCVQTFNFFSLAFTVCMTVFLFVFYSFLNINTNRYMVSQK